MTEPHETPALAHWLPATDSPFGVEVLDCRETAASWMSLTSDPTIGPRWALLRASDGAEYRGQEPVDATTFECDLHFNANPPPEGPLFKGETMEDKWDIYHYAGGLYFTRSWTGELVYRAQIESSEGPLRVGSLRAAAEYAEDGARFCIESVHYLVGSHLFDVVAVHPLLERLGRDPERQATFSFGQHGRRGMFGTFAPTLALPGMRRRVEGA